MGSIKFLASWVFLVLIFSIEIQFTNGRQTNLWEKVATEKLIAGSVKLPNGHAKGGPVTNNLRSRYSGQATGEYQSPPPSMGHVDDFRPTAPGRSPGVGHSLKN
ncbi:hypothetical protein Nepgr_025933 [Nepenthes gracilis]|uniref:Uncharacterized protein n=1 Tax=Nepenthes gracilis TaxID=150966 RepID=A0AAD3Y1K7_NEPGR|nr:hypothetical protein Nepgr_025933 [Nepenthes gracilis]